MRVLSIVILVAASSGIVAGCRCGEPGGSDSAAALDAEPGTDAATGTDAAAASDAGPGTDAAALTCDSSSTTDLPGVTITFPAQTCVFTLAEAAAGIAVAYDVVVSTTVDGVVPAPQDAGQCGAPGPSGLIVFESLSGGGQGYCLCDQGLCAPPSPTPIQLQPGTYGGTFGWMGRNWSGPSDTGNPMGAPFPPGSYTLSVSAVGTMGPLATPFTVTGTFSVYLVP